MPSAFSWKLSMSLSSLTAHPSEVARLCTSQALRATPPTLGSCPGGSTEKPLQVRSTRGCSARSEHRQLAAQELASARDMWLAQFRAGTAWPTHVDRRRDQ